MMKKALLVGLVCMCGLSYAATEDSFNIKARIVEPLAIELNEHTLDFGYVSRGTLGTSKNIITATITGEEDTTVKVTFKVGEKEIENGEVSLKNQNNQELIARLYLGNDPGDVVATTAYPLDNGKISFDIKGTLNVPNDSKYSGNYESENVVVSVVYDK